MVLTRRHTLTLGLSALALSTVFTALAWSSRPSSGLQLLPQLAKYDFLGWLGSDALLVIPGGSPDRATNAAIFRLQTHAFHPLPPLPELPPFTAAEPVPSPDGRWVLYKESEGGGPENATPYATRWRLMRVDGGETRMFPSDGSFRPTPDEVGYPLPYAYWLPDSSGWTSVADTDHAHHQKLERFRLDALDGAPERLVFPGANINHLNLEDITPDGRLVFTDYAEYTLQLCAPVSGSVPTPPFRLTLLFDGLSQFTSDGNAALALVEVHTTGLSAWFANLIHRPVDTVDLRRIPFNGAPPTTMAANLPVTTHFNISPDQKHVLIRADQLYVVPL
ncbi:hypothetical protein [Armatimonas sp.]|uniref:hypothetical protein n=1 Tax=Armatimonas sp. TaxID=1872638 RepID=UPI00374D9209